jgi:hypothetical protein
LEIWLKITKLYRGLIVFIMANKPTNPQLYSRVKAEAKKKFDRWPSAYGSAWLVKEYKRRGGGYRKAEDGMEIPGYDLMNYGGMMENRIQRLENREANLVARGNRAVDEGRERRADRLLGRAARVENRLIKAKESASEKNMMDVGNVEWAPNPLFYNSMGGMIYGDYTFPMMDDGGEMALGQIAAVTDKMSKLQQFLNPNSDIEPWVASKLAVMDDSAGAIYDYMMYNPEALDAEEPDMEEMREGGIPSRYKNMGFNKVGVKKQSNRPGKKWMVLAKKGDKYKVVHGGYKGMKDFTQHRNENRRDRFWNRMGGRNSAKATDPFSPLYWHKRFGTWAEGGEPQNEGFQALPEAVQAKIMANMMYGGDMYAMGGMPCYECGGQMKYKKGGTPFIAMAYFEDGGMIPMAQFGMPMGSELDEFNFQQAMMQAETPMRTEPELDFSAFQNMEPMMEVSDNEKIDYIPGASANQIAGKNFMFQLSRPGEQGGRFNPTLATKNNMFSLRGNNNSKIFPYVQAAGVIGKGLINFGSWLGKRNKENTARIENSRRSFSDNLFPTMPSGITGERGNFDVFGNFRPDETLASRTYFSQMGGEIEMTDDQIRQLVALGAEIEILD